MEPKIDRRTTDGAEARKTPTRTQLDTLLTAPNGTEIIIPFDRSLHLKAKKAGLVIKARKVLIVEHLEPHALIEGCIVTKVGTI